MVGAPVDNWHAQVTIDALEARGLRPSPLRSMHTRSAFRAQVWDRPTDIEGRGGLRSMLCDATFSAAGALYLQNATTELHMALEALTMTAETGAGLAEDEQGTGRRRPA